MALRPPFPNSYSSFSVTRCHHHGISLSVSVLISHPSSGAPVPVPRCVFRLSVPPPGPSAPVPSTSISPVPSPVPPPRSPSPPSPVPAVPCRLRRPEEMVAIRRGTAVVPPRWPPHAIIWSLCGGSEPAPAATSSAVNGGPFSGSRSRLTAALPW